MNDPQAAPVSYAQRLEDLALDRPSDTAIVSVDIAGTERAWTWVDLRDHARARAMQLESEGIGAGDVVLVALPNSLEWYAAVFGSWYRGAVVLPIDAALPEQGRLPILTLAAGHWNRAFIVDASVSVPTRMVDDVPTIAPAPDPGLAVLSGGSTGAPKIIINHGAHEAVPTTGTLEGVAGAVGMVPDQTQLVTGPLYHGAPSAWSTLGLFHGHTLVVMTRFDARLAADLIEKHQVNWAFLVPTMMRRIAQLPTITSSQLSSLHAIIHASAPCPPSVKRQWLRLVEPKRVIEGFGGSEAAGVTIIRGDEWLERPGSVGKPLAGYEVAIFDDNGQPQCAGQVGLIHMRATYEPTRARFTYLGAPVQRAADGWVSIGDLGWLDEEGFLFIADRRTDLIITGGSNVYPAEVEAVLLDHPAVSDVAVVGLSDPDLGRRVHAIVEPRDPVNPPAVEALQEHCRRQVSNYKVPRTITFTVRLPRNDQGKLRRSALAAELEEAEREAAQV